jgi:ETFB lysine methyltransferase
LKVDALIALDAELRRRFRVRETEVVIAGRSVRLLHPENAEDLINEADFARDERLPYWADLWPSARILSQRVLALPRGRRLLELGCGMGLVTVCAVLAGLEVVATDYYEDALSFARVNCWRNAGTDVTTRLIDWRDLPPRAHMQFDVVVASDVLYERWQAAHLARAFKRFLATSSLGILADPGRVAVGDFLTEARGLGLEVAEPIAVPYAEDSIRQTIRLYDIRLAG